MMRLASCVRTDEAARAAASWACSLIAGHSQQRSLWFHRGAQFHVGAFITATPHPEDQAFRNVTPSALLAPHKRISHFWSTTRQYSSGNLPAHDVLTMPALSPTMESGTLVEWKVKPGDEVEAGSVLADIETDKATLGLETQDDCFVAKLLVENGTKDIRVGVPVAVLVDRADAVAQFADFTASSPSGASPTPPPASQPVASPGTAGESIIRSSKIGPAARMALTNAGLSVQDIDPTGPQGIVTKSDVLAAISSGKTATAPPQAPPVAQAPKAAPPQLTAAPASSPASPLSPSAADGHGRLARGERFTDVPVTSMRRVIAQRLVQSKQSTPAIYMAARVRLQALTTFRNALKTAGIKASVNDFVIKAVAKALVAVPGASASWDEASESVKLLPDVDISVAVATEGGLITPIVKAADVKTISEIGTAMKDLAGRARENKLKPEEFMGGSFSISNLGMFGIKEFSAIINPPQACILAVGGPQEQCVQDGSNLLMESFMNVRLSADNRAVDEATAARFLESFSFHMENPGLLMAG